MVNNRERKRLKEASYDELEEHDCITKRLIEREEEACNMSAVESMVYNNLM